jgi:hypothetical protein
MNIYFLAEREIFVPGIDKSTKQKKYIHVWQTPTNVTYEIVKAKDPIKAYFEWVLKVSEEETRPVYAEDDIFNEREPIGQETFLPGKVHIEELKICFDSLKKDGYTIKAIIM